MRFSKKDNQSWLIAAVLCVLLASLHVAAQMKAGAQVKGFKVADDQAGRRKSILNGREAKLLSKDVWLIQDLRLEIFREDGEPAMTVTSPECTYDNTARVASSPGALALATGDKGLSLTGRGFRWVQTNEILAVSNDVATLIQRPATNAESGKVEPGEPIRVTSASVLVDYARRVVVYEGGVHVFEAQSELTCEKLTVTLPAASNAVERIVAENRVVITNRQDGTSATASRGDYRATGGTIELSGDASWTAVGGRNGRADKVLYNRNTRGVDAEGSVFVQVPQDPGDRGASLIPLPRSGVSSSKTKATFLEIRADRFHSTTNENVFTGSVKVTEPQNPEGSQLFADKLTLGMKLGKMETVRAEGGVLAVQEHREIRAKQADYQAETGLTIFNGSPKWKFEERDGSGDLITYNQTNGEFRVTGNALMNLPRGMMGGQGFMPPGFAPSTNRVPPADGFVHARAAELRGTTNAVFMNGGVHIEIPQALAKPETLDCARFEVHYVGTSNRLERMLADGGVRFVSPGTNGVDRTFETARVKAVWNKGGTEMERMDADGGVILTRGDMRATSDRAALSGVSGIAELTGKPEAVTGKLKIVGADRLIWDMRQNRLGATGPWKSEIRPQVDPPKPKAPAGKR